MVYRLPNGKILDEKGIFVAMTDGNIFNHHFLDIQTGEVQLVSEEFDINPDDILKKLKNKHERYFEIPKIVKETRYFWMKEFVEEMIDTVTLRNKLNFVLSKDKDFSTFEKTLYADKSGWIWGWVQGKVFKLADAMLDWLIEINLDFKEEWDYDDDCPLCQMMKYADEGGKHPTLSETKAAFLKVKQQGGIVGGDWFDKK